MSNSEKFVILSGFAIINVMAGIGAAWFLREMAWTYMAFIAVYFYAIHKIGINLEDGE